MAKELFTYTEPYEGVENQVYERCWRVNKDGTGTLDANGTEVARFRWSWGDEEPVFCIFYFRHQELNWTTHEHLTKAYQVYLKLLVSQNPPYDISLAQLKGRGGSHV